MQISVFIYKIGQNFTLGMSSYQVTIENSFVQERESYKNVLVVDDDEVSFILLNEILSSYNMKPIRAINGKDAINFFKSDKDAFDLVLMDIRMPKVDGLEATKRIKEINPAIPVFAVTAYTHSKSVMDCFDAGCDEYIPKPFEIAKLLSVIRNYIAIEN